MHAIKRLTPPAACAQCNVTDNSRYYDDGESACLECEGSEIGESAGAAFGILVLVLLLLALIGRVGKFKLSSSQRALHRLKVMYESINVRAKIKQLIALYQILTRLGDTFLVPMPTAVAELLSALDFLSLDIASFGFPLGCLSELCFCICNC